MWLWLIGWKNKIMASAKASVELNDSLHRMMRARFRAGVKGLGLTGIFGIGVFAMCAAFYFSALLPGKARLEMLYDSVAQLEKTGIEPGGITDVKLTQAEQLAIFYGSFPTKSSVPTLLEKIYAAAANERLNLYQADYKASRTSVEKMSRYQITLPIRGRYSRIHKFLIKVLRDVPNASLEHVLFERKKIGDSSVDATVVLVLHLVSES